MVKKVWWAATSWTTKLVCCIHNDVILKLIIVVWDHLNGMMSGRLQFIYPIDDHSFVIWNCRSIMSATQNS